MVLNVIFWGNQMSLIFMQCYLGGFGNVLEY